MVAHLAHSSRLDKYVAFLVRHLKRKCEKYAELETQILALAPSATPDVMTTVELEKTFRGITCSLNVLVQLSEPAYPSALQQALTKVKIETELISLVRICLRFQFRTPPRLRQLLVQKPKMMQMLRLW